MVGATDPLVNTPMGGLGGPSDANNDGVIDIRDVLKVQQDATGP